MSLLVDLRNQVQGVLPSASGGTGNPYGLGLGDRRVVVNGSGATWPHAAALAVDASGQVGLTTADNPGPFFGVVRGTATSPSGDNWIEGDVADGATAVLQCGGIAPFLIDDGNAYRYFVSAGGDAADGHVIGTAAPSPTSLGFVWTIGYVALTAGGLAISSSGFLSKITLQAGNGADAIVAPGYGTSEIVPWAGSIVGVRLVSETGDAGDAVCDLYAGPESLWPPSTSICASALPTLSSAAYVADDTLTGWTVAFDAHTAFRLYVVSASTVKQLSLHLFLRQGV